MPHFVTHILVSRRVAAPAMTRRARLDHHTRAADAYRRRLAALRTRAPDTLRDRVRRELRAAGESTTSPE